MIKPAPARRSLALVVALLTLLTAACASAPAPPAAGQIPEEPSATAAPRAILAEPAYAAELEQQAEPTPTRPSLSGVVTPTAPPEQAQPTQAPPTQAPASGSATAIPTPSPRAAGAPPRVGLQAGHWKSNELPEELARLRTSTGARYGDVTEAELNLDIANRIKPLLEAQGVIVDILPATVPPSYDADAFVAIHADGSRSAAARGWKLATPWRASRASEQLMAGVAAAYGPATGLPEDVGGVTVNMKGYYAFNYRRHVHAIARTTPAIIVEMGFMSNAADRAVMFNQPDRVASGVAQGILAYLAQRDPRDGAALLPPEYPNLRTGPNGATMRADARDDARVIARLSPDSRIFAIDRRDGWYRVYARDVPNTPGWVREDQVVIAPAGTPQPEPTATDS